MSLVPSASFCYIFKIVLGTSLLYRKSFNNFESSLLLQFLKCYEIKKISPSMYDPYHLLKSHFSQKSFCYHVYQLPEAATGDFWKNFEKFTKKSLCWSLLLIKLQAFRYLGLRCTCFYRIFDNFKSVKGRLSTRII